MVRIGFPVVEVREPQAAGVRRHQAHAVRSRVYFDSTGMPHLLRAVAQDVGNLRCGIRREPGRDESATQLLSLFAETRHGYSPDTVPYTSSE